MPVVYVVGRRCSGRTTVVGRLMQSPFVRQQSGCIVYDDVNPPYTPHGSLCIVSTQEEIAEHLAYLYAMKQDQSICDFAIFTQPLALRVAGVLLPEIVHVHRHAVLFVKNKGKDARWMMPKELSTL